MTRPDGRWLHSLLKLGRFLMEKNAGVENGLRLMPLEQFEDGDVGDCFVLIENIELRRARNGKQYYILQLRGRERQVSMLLFEESEYFAECQRAWSPGRFLKVRGQFAKTDYGEQFKLGRARLATEADRKDGFDPAEFVRASRFNPEDMFRALCDLAEEHVADVPLRKLVLRTLERYAEQLKRIPAARHMHHAVLGGYLEHVLSVTKTVIHLADKYREYYSDLDPPISKSVAVAGAVLHDIGKLRELSCEGTHTDHSVAGKLLGHMILGRDIVREVAAEVPELTEETLLEIEHIIAAHQARPEWGAVVEPRTIECIMVHYADDVDAKVNMMAEALRRDRGKCRFTSRDNPLRRQIYRPNRQGETGPGRQPLKPADWSESSSDPEPAEEQEHAQRRRQRSSSSLQKELPLG